MKKKFGQNFLKNQQIINEIINFCEISKESSVYEIGPGDGALTREVIKINPKKFIAVEIDIGLKDRLDILFNNKRQQIIYADALKFEETSYFTDKTIVIGNLPYNISIQLLIKWIHQYSKKKWIKTMILMFQKEVAERIISDQNSKKYGRITLLASALFNISFLMNINKKDFFPIPKVDSTLLKFEPLETPHLDEEQIYKLEFLSNQLFSSRRKKLKNKIETLFNPQIIKKNNLEQYYDLIAENLSRDIFFSLAKLL